jgi:hypothetical protein
VILDQVPSDSLLVVAALAVAASLLFLTALALELYVETAQRDTDALAEVTVVDGATGGHGVSTSGRSGGGTAMPG